MKQLPSVVNVIVSIALGVTMVRTDVEAKGRTSDERNARKAAEEFLAAVTDNRPRDAVPLLASTTTVAKDSTMREWIDRFHVAFYKTATPKLLTIEEVVANKEAGLAFAITEPAKLRGIWNDTACVVLDLTFDEDRHWRISDVKIWNWLTAAKNFHRFKERLKQEQDASSAPMAVKKGKKKENTITVAGVCHDRQAKPLDGATINIIRESYQKRADRPRVETFGRTKTAPDGTFQLRDLPPIWKHDPRSQYILYFTLPSRPAQSLLVNGDLPDLSNLSVGLVEDDTRDVYVPPFHAAVRFEHGVTVLEARDGAFGFFKRVDENRYR